VIVVQITLTKNFCISYGWGVFESLAAHAKEPIRLAFVGKFFWGATSNLAKQSKLL
jgi:hypothetical protein